MYVYTIQVYNLCCAFIRLFENSLFFNLFILCMHPTRFKCYTYKRIGTKAFNCPEMFYQYKNVIYIFIKFD